MSQYYSDYLKLEAILNAQQPVSFQPPNQPAHYEMLFIITHQAYELWFKQALFEVESVIAIMQQSSLNDNSPQLQTAVHRISRVNTILKVLVQQVDVMETMTPMDFLDFRDLVRPASGFQSVKFKLLEARLGLSFRQRHEKQYYTSSLRPEFQDLILKAQSKPGLLILLSNWLERMPFFKDEMLWDDFITPRENVATGVLREAGVFWTEYRSRLCKSLLQVEIANLTKFDELLIDGAEPESGFILSPAAARAALFIMLYRGYPVLQQPLQLINAVLETDELLSNWRYRHMNMVHRIIGRRIGTGGSTGENYLKGAAEKHYIFKDFALLTSFLIERCNLPRLGVKLERRLGFVAD
jgi:tryptophan 2,3-dioxygenase